MASATSTPVRPHVAVLLLLLVSAAAVGPYWSPSVALAMSDLIAYFPSLYASLPAMWDPTVQGGSPLLPNPQGGWFYPPAWLLAGDLQAGLPLYVFGHLALLGIATWAWVRTRLGDGLEALLAGVIGVGSGATFSLFLTPDKLPGHAALPVLLFGLHWMLGDDRPRRRALGWWIAIAAVAMTWFGGSVESIFIAGIAAPAWALGLPGASGARRMHRVLGALAVLVVGTLLASCLLVPFFELLPETARSGRLPMEVALQRSTHPVDWLGWLAPNPFWAGEELRYVLDDAGTSRGRWLRTIYGGCLLAPLLVGLAAARERGPGAGLAALGAAGFVFLALGDLNPIKGLLHALPGVGSMRYPDKWWLGTVPFQAWLAALGLRAVLSDRRAARAAAATASALLAVAVGGLLVQGGPPLARTAQALSGTLPTLALGAALLVALATDRRQVTWLLPAVIAVDLLVAGAAAFPRADAAAMTERPPVVSAIRADWLNRIDGDRAGAPRIWDESQHVYDGRLPDAPPGERHRAIQRAVLGPNTGVEHGLAYVDGMRAIRMERQALYSAVLEDLDPRSRRNLLRAVGADYWVTYTAVEALALARAAGLRPVPAAPGVGLDVGLLAEPAPLPRVRLVTRRQDFTDDAAAYRFMQSRTADVVALVDGDPGVDALPGLDAPSLPTGISGWEAAPGRWEVAWESPSDAILVLQQTWAPGWSVSVDGGPWVPAARVEHLLVGAAAPAGRHSAVIAYRPVGLGTGVALSLFAVLIALAGGLVPGWSGAAAEANRGE